MRGGQAISNDRNGLPLESGFVTEPVGTHSSRTIMLRELTALLDFTDASASYENLRDAAVLENALQKASAAGRAKTFRHLREFYSLHPEVPLFASLRRLWDIREAERPLLAILCAAARDPILLASADFVLPIPPGDRVDKADVETFLTARHPARYSETVLPRIVRNLLSSWTQSGHLTGHLVKLRGRAEAGPVSTAYALLLGYLCGRRGEGLFDSPWTRFLDCTVSETHEHAGKAHEMGLVTLKRAGGIVDVDVAPILSTKGSRS